MNQSERIELRLAVATIIAERGLGVSWDMLAANRSGAAEKTKAIDGWVNYGVHQDELLDAADAIMGLCLTEIIEAQDADNGPARQPTGAQVGPVSSASIPAAELLRLTAALNRIATIVDPLRHTGPSATKVSEIRVIVRAALSTPPEHGEKGE